MYSITCQRKNVLSVSVEGHYRAVIVWNKLDEFQREEDEILVKFQNTFIVKTLRFHLAVFLILATQLKPG